MGIRVATSCLLGALLNFAVLAPIMIHHGDIVARVTAGGAVIPISRAEIVNQWSLWWGVTAMVVGSVVSLLGKPELFTGILRRRGPAGGRRTPTCCGTSSCRCGCRRSRSRPSPSSAPAFRTMYFGVPWFLAFISFPLIFVLAIICANSIALTSWMPTGPLAKITQFTMAAFDRTNPASNLIPAGMTAEISSNAASLLSDIKPGYMLGAKPRQQAAGHVIGIISGACTCVPLFYLLFLPPARDGTRSAATLVSDKFAMPAAVQWRGVAELIAHGLRSLPASAVASMAVAAVCAVAFEVARIATKGRFPLSAVSIGLGVVLPPEYVFTMWLGAMAFWWQGRRHPEPGTRGHVFWVEGCEPISAGLISGWALTGIVNSVINVLFY